MSLPHFAAAHFLRGDGQESGRQLETNASFFIIGRIVKSFIRSQDGNAADHAIRSSTHGACVSLRMRNETARLDQVRLHDDSLTAPGWG